MSPPTFQQRILAAREKYASTPLPWAEFANYLDAVEFQHRKSPDRAAFLFHGEDGRVSPLTFAGALERARLFGSALVAAGARPGDRLGILMDTSPEFVTAYFGAMHAGCVPFVAALPTSRQNLAHAVTRLAAILADCGARWLTTSPDFLAAERALRAGAPALERIFTVESLLADARERGVPLRERHPAGSTDVALLQYTSGSTSRPRAIPVTHASLLGMIREVGRAIQLHDEDVSVNWLPLFHDLGLVCYFFCTTAHGTVSHLISPRQFISDPLLWLRLISQERATFSGGAPFAYRLCVKAAQRDAAAVAGLDLASLIRTSIGGERIPASLIQDFTAAFAPCGFHPDALIPAYGLAENVVNVSYKPLGEPTRIVTGPDGVPLVSNGPPLPGCTVSISAEGEIVLDSDYSGANRVVHTGDLGFLRDGELYVIGRLKEIIIRAGENIAPEYLEECCQAAPGISLGPVAALGVPSDELATENIVILAEIREANGLPDAEIGALLASEVLARSGHAVHRVYLMPKGGIPRTSSGKVQRGLAKRQLLDGQLRHLAAV